AALSASFEIVNTTCYGGDGGSATVSVTGGTAPYEYFWYYMEIGEPTIENVPSGTYPVVITDANGCELIAEAEVLDAEEMIASFSVEEVTCFGGMDGGATVTVSGGVEPYEYFWYYMEIGEPMLEDVPSGTYPVVITDANGCEIIAETEIGSPEPILISFESTATTCNGGEDGTATAIVSGGTAPYTYLWEDGQTTEMATGLSAGLHSVTITDANGCILTKEVTVDDAEPIEIELSTEEVTCHGGSNGAATVIASGGAGGYTYLWNDGQTSATAVDLSAGIYTVNITDANSCSIEVPVEVGEAVPLELSFEVNDVDCYGTSTGTAEVNVIGGTAPYEYFWYYMEIGTPMIDEVPAGAYTVVITDANGCTITGETIVGQPESALEADVLTEGASCEEGEDGSATVEVIGGTPGYTYLWNNGQTTATASGLSPGTYSVLISDAMGCEFEVEGILITGGAPIAIEITTTDISCYGESSGSAVAEVIGGEAPYAYLWSDGQTSASATDLEAGTYGVTVTDANGCTSESTDITIHEGDMLTLDIDTFIGEICDGMVWVTPSGGTAPYTYEWEHGADEADLTDLCEGVYFVTVTDANGCSVSSDVVIAYSLMGIQISLAPNPSIGATKVNIKTEAETGIYVDVLNAGGQEVKDDVFSGKTDETGIVEVELETSGLERGVYFVRVRTISGVEVERLVVQ
uniref:T9SS type A sorting domain-containing protein n=1 Tax=Crocinitomix algicola TaxID=1740263 RepID=UPI001112FD0F